MSARFLKLRGVQVDAYDANNPTATVDVLLNAEAIVTVLSDEGAELAVVTLSDGRRLMVSAEQAEEIDALVLREGRHA